jgi:uncharacterized tellurite resistance protein B-like protein
MAENQNAFFKDFVAQVFANSEKDIQTADEHLHPGKKKSSQKNAELELALSVLLVDLAGCDENFEPAEYQLISNGLRRLFGTSKTEVSALINRANLALANLRGVGQFAEILKDSLNADQKQATIEIIEDIIAADGQEDAFETHLRSKLHRMLGIEAA